MADNRPRQESTLPPADGSLHSWKEIAVHLRRDVRTVQRWEKSEGLPVHRHWHRSLGSVYAYKAELDAWWNNHHARLEPKLALEATEAPGDTGLEVAQVEEKAPRRWRLGAWLALGGVSLGIALAGAVYLRPKWRTQPVQSARPAATRLLAIIEGETPDGGFGHSMVAADVDGDGREDIIAGSINTEEIGIFLAPRLALNLSLSRDASVLLRHERGYHLRLLALADINRDGLKDLILWESLPDPAGFARTGKVFVLFSRRQWNAKLILPADANVQITNTFSYNAGACRTVHKKATDLDWNGDGMEDLVLVFGDYSPPERASAGGVLVFWGRKQWPAQLDLENADVTVWGAYTGEELCQAAVGDINGDGKNDLVVAACDGTLSGLRQQRGRVYAFFGRERFPRRLDAATDYDLRIEGAQPRDSFSHLTLGDLNGDGMQDITVGAPGAGEAKSGRAFVYFGRKKWPRELGRDLADWVLDGNELDTHFGSSVLAHDLNRDTADDLLVCAGHSRRDPIRVFYGDSHRSGRASADAAADFGLSAGDPKDGGCSEGLDVADLDGNHTPEILVGAPRASVAGKPRVGKAYVLAPYQPVQIDIRPGYYPNPLWPGSQHIAVVAVLARDGFDPKNLDLSTVRFAGAQPMSNRVAPSGTSDPPTLYVYFDSRDLRLKPTDRTAVLTGKTKDGTPVFGVDSVLVLSDPASKP